MESNCPIERRDGGGGVCQMCRIRDIPEKWLLDRRRLSELLEWEYGRRKGGGESVEGVDEFGGGRGRVFYRLLAVGKRSPQHSDSNGRGRFIHTQRGYGL